jgi:hypothetical protein
LYSKTTVNLDISAIDVARQVLDEHVHDMCYLFRFGKCTGRNPLLVPAMVNIWLERGGQNLETYSSLTFASAQAFLPKAVQTGPGLTLLDVIPFGPHSRAMLRVKPRRPALLAQ